ncbi:hypothetical protein E2C01_087709 [Portunus trituberculatus]|uniref:Uncharacterized protein n=1 Tax=Portunus trituberculatus TaxID=210409 RepID=A0A5B7J7B7_PORTR|nr:hypothetical protein [Portunus trituberculatus]
MWCRDPTSRKTRQIKTNKQHWILQVLRDCEEVHCLITNVHHPTKECCRREEGGALDTSPRPSQLPQCRFLPRHASPP